MQDQPGATLTFLFTDIEGSTDLVQRLGDRRYADLLDHHRALLRRIFTEHRGREIDTQGDAFFVVFPNAHQGVLAALDIQQAVAAHRWAQDGPLHVRIGLHTGEAVQVGSAYVGVDVHRAARICGAGHGGQILLSAATQALVAGRLPAGVTLQDLGEHRLRDLRRAEHIYQILHPFLPTAVPPLRSLSVLQHNLPVQLTSFVGRASEMADLRRLLAATRLLTLSGPGGSGKTRLAQQLAAESLEGFSDGVWLVELAVLSDPALIPSAIAAVLDVREEPGRPILTMVSDLLRSKRLLLLLDNCEHLVASCAHVVATLLRTASQVVIVATSRERLGVPGEVIYPVPPLSLPRAWLHRPDDMLQSEAVRLFVDRAASVLPGFVLTETNAAEVAQIVRRLDGIPLAIELAAARVNVLPVPQIAARLDDRFSLLTAGSRTVEPRQQTLQATMDWSYELLSGPERTLLRRLAVFAGGFALDAVERVCANGGLHVRDVVDVLSHLVDKSLVMTGDGPLAARYRLLETVRQYGQDKLDTASEATATRRRHLEYFLQVAEEAEPRLRGREQTEWLQRLEVEHDNLRAALTWSREAGPAEAHVRLVTALWLFWYIRTYYLEGSEWLQRALAVATDAPPALRAKVLYAAGLLAWCRGANDDAERLSAESLALCRQTGDRSGVAFSLLNLGIVNRRGQRYGDAAACHQESLELFLGLGDTWGAAWSTRLLGIVTWYRGEYARAKALFEESLALSRTQQDPEGVASALHGLGRIAVYQNDFRTAEPMLRESLRMYRELGDWDGISATLHIIGYVAAGTGRYARAVQLFSAAEALSKMIGVPLGGPGRADYERLLGAARSALGGEGFSVLWSQGETMGADAAMTVAIQPE